MGEYNEHSGISAGTAVGIGIAAIFGVGLLWASNRNANYGYNHGGACGCVDPYLLGENNGQVKAGIACNANSIARLENTLSQMQQNMMFASVVDGAANRIQMDTNAGMASISTNVGRLNDTVNSALGNRFVWSRDVCNPCGCTTPTTPTSSTQS